MMLCRWLTAVLPFVTCLLDAPVIVAARGGRKKTRGKASSGTSGAGSSAAAAQEGDTDPAGSSVSGSATERKNSGSAEPTRGSTETVEGRSAAVREKVAVVEGQFGVVEHQVAAPALEDHAGDRSCIGYALSPASVLAETQHFSADEETGARSRARGEAASAGLLERSAADTGGETGAGEANYTVLARDDGARSSENGATATSVHTGFGSGAEPRLSPYPSRVFARIVEEPEAPTTTHSSPRDPNTAGALAWYREIIHVDDLVATLRCVCGIYRIRGGEDFNEMLRHLRNACNVLAAKAITDSQRWTAAAAEALQRGRMSLHALQSRDPSVLTGRLAPTPQFSQRARTRRRSRLAALGNELQLFVSRRIALLAEEFLRVFGGPSEAKRVLLHQFYDAERLFLGIRQRYQDVWFLYGDFVYAWIIVKQTSLMMDLEDEEGTEMKPEEGAPHADQRGGTSPVIAQETLAC